MQKLSYDLGYCFVYILCADEQAPLSRHFVHKMVMDCDGTIVVRCMETTYCSIKFARNNFFSHFLCSSKLWREKNWMHFARHLKIRRSRSHSTIWISNILFYSNWKWTLVRLSCGQWRIFQCVVHYSASCFFNIKEIDLVRRPLLFNVLYIFMSLEALHTALIWLNLNQYRESH